LSPAAAGTTALRKITYQDATVLRHGDFITPGGKFPRLTKKEAKARLKEIKRFLLAL